MVREWRNGCKVVIPQRRTRAGENCLKRAFAYTAYWFINKTASVPIPRNAGDFRLLDRMVIDELMRLHESHGFLRGLTSVVGFETKLLPFDRQPRAGGKTKYLPITGGIGIGFNGVLSFSNFLLNAITAMGVLLALGSMVAIVVLALAKAYDWYAFSSGVATVAVLVLFLGGAQLMALGIIGAYISRIYDEVKMRPKFIVERSLGIDL
jgi:dolichol-phosphate mannosyltransferase